MRLLKGNRPGSNLSYPNGVHLHAIDRYSLFCEAQRCCQAHKTQADHCYHVVLSSLLSCRYLR